MKNHAFIFSALFICSALFPLPEFMVEKQTPSAPKPRHLEEIAFDKSNNALYMFGGSEHQDQTWKEPVELYLFKDGWKRIESKGPLGRRGHALIYDDVEKRILLIGGVCQTKSGGDSVLFDVWKLVNDEWSILEIKCPVKEPRAVYDRDQKRILVYGDANNLTKPWSGGDEHKFELWEFRSEKWTRLSDEGPADGPFPLTYNEKNQSLTFLQWKDLNRLVIWEWSKEKWKTQEFTSNVPVRRNKFAFCYSSTDDALIVVGGVDSNKNLLGDIWKFKGKRWTAVSSTSTPSPRASLRLIDTGDYMLLYGGVTKAGLTNELWQFRNNVWTKQ